MTKCEEWPVPGKPDCFLQLLHDLVFANLADEHLLGMEEGGHGGNSREGRINAPIQKTFEDED